MSRTPVRLLPGLKPLVGFRQQGWLMVSPRRPIWKSGKPEGTRWPQALPDFLLSRFKKNGEARLNHQILKAAFLLLALATALRAAAATNTPAPLVLDGLAAEVGGARITIAETLALARELAAALQQPAPGAGASLREAYAEAQEQLVARQLVLQAYAAQENKLPPWAVERRVAEVIDEHFGGDRSQLVSMLTRQGLGFDAWRQRLEEEMVTATMHQQFVERHVVVAPTEIRAFYTTNAAAFAVEGPVRAGLILLAPRDGESAEALAGRARQVLAEIRAGKDFRAVARRESAEAHAREGGDWGYIDPAEVFRKELADALAGLKVGEVGEPVATETGVYLLTKFDERADRVMPLEAAWAGIESRLRRIKAESRRAAWIESLKRKTTVRYFPLP